MKRQYLGCAGKVANGINTVHLAYVREGTGHALIGAREWIPAAQIGDPARSAVMGLPQGTPRGGSIGLMRSTWEGRPIAGKRTAAAPASNPPLCGLVACR